MRDTGTLHAMKIAIDASPLSWTTRGGIKRVCLELLPALIKVLPGDEVELITDRAPPGGQHLPIRMHVLAANRATYLMYELHRFVRNGGYDAVLILSAECAPMPVPTVQLVYDLYPLKYPSMLPWRYMRDLRYWIMYGEVMARMALIRRVESVVAISEDTARAIRAHCGARVRRITVAYPGASSYTTIPDPYNSTRCELPDQEYLLYVGALNAHKNITQLVHAFSEVRNRHRRDLALVIVGHANWPYLLDAESICTTPGVRLIADCSDAELALLYSRCAGYVCLSHYEGFGLPVLEAMANGAPVIVNNAGALPEVVGDAGITVEATDQSAVVEAILRVLDPAMRMTLAEKSRSRAAMFTWDTMATKVAQELHAVAHRSMA